MGKTAVITFVLSVLLGATTAASESVWISFDGTPEPQPPTVSIDDASQTSVTLHIQVHGMFVRDTVVEGTRYDIFSFPEEGTESDVGRPQLPQVTKLVGFAPEATISVDVGYDDLLVLSGYYAFPAQEPVFEPACPLAFAVDPTTYFSDVWFPDIYGSAHEVFLGVWRDLSVSVVVARPVVFNPVQQQLRIYRSLTVTVSFEGGEPLPLAVLAEYWRMYDDALANFGCLGVEELEGNLQSKYFFLIGESGPGPITAGIWPLRVWKAMRGCGVVREHVGSWSADDIKDYIRDRFVESEGAYELYFLLVGDHSHAALPHSGSDHWYACVVGDDNIADVPVGRIPVSTRAGAASAAEKVTKYERNQSPDWEVENVLLVNHWFFQSTMDDIQAVLDGQGVPYDRQDGRSPGVTNQSVKDRIHAGGGYGILNYFGHGSIVPDRWFQWTNQTPSDDFTSADVYSLENAECLPLVYNIACSSAHHGAGHCGAWTRNASGGGIAAWGFSAVAYAEPSKTLNEWLQFLPYELPESRTWLVTNTAKMRMLEAHPDGYGAATNTRFHLVGDPSLNIWTTDNGPLVVQSSPRAFYTESLTVVVCKVTRPNGLPVSGVWVGAHKAGWPSPEILTSAITGSDGIAYVSMTPLTEGPIETTAFRPLYRTGEDLIRACQGDVAIDGSQDRSTGVPILYKASVATVLRGEPRVRVDVPYACRIRLTVCDAAGRVVAETHPRGLSPGIHWIRPTVSGGGSLAPGFTSSATRANSAKVS